MKRQRNNKVRTQPTGNFNIRSKFPGSSSGTFAFLYSRAKVFVWGAPIPALKTVVWASVVFRAAYNFNSSNWPWVTRGKLLPPQESSAALSSAADWNIALFQALHSVKCYDAVRTCLIAFNLLTEWTGITASGTAHTQVYRYAHMQRHMRCTVVLCQSSRVRSIGTSALCNAVSNSESHGYKWDIGPTSGWNDFPCEIWTECTTHSDSCVIETKCCFHWCGAPRGAVASPGSNGSPACNLVVLCNHGHHLLFLDPSFMA